MMKEITALLQQKMGLEASSIGASNVEQSIQARMAQVGAASPESYLTLLHVSPAEMDELIEEVVVPESWFFRDGSPFVALKRWVAECWQPAHPGGVLRVLTAPCSTGEEPYSVAIALFDAGLSAERFIVDAVDISRRALARARRGVYGSNSFRGRSLEFRDRYFTALAGAYTILPKVRQQVRFEFGNLLAADFRPSSGHYDVIFCRNVLIYFDRKTQAKTVQVLGGLLAPDGLFFAGHAETTILGSNGFIPTNYPMSFSFRKAPPVSAAPPAEPRPTRTSRVPPASAPVPPSPRRTVTVITRRIPRRTPLLPPVEPAAVLLDDLEAARRLADSGRLAEASRLCETHLRARGDSAAAWYLLGVIRDAAGDRPRAAECYSKTLYLAPDHQEALLQRALLAEQTGDGALASRLRSRLQRIQQRTAAA